MKGDLKMFEEKCREEKRVFSGVLLNLNEDMVELNDGSVKTREYIKTADASCCVALDKDNNIILVKQFRYAHRKELIELPAGKIDFGETPIEAAKRELLEETGFISNEWEELGFFYPATYSTQKLYIFLAKNVEWQRDLSLDEGEFLSVLKVSYKDFLKDVLGGKIKDSKTIIGVLKYNERLSL